MPNTYKYVEVIGSSTISIDDAIKNAIHNCGEKNLDWFEVKEIRGHLDAASNIAHYQVSIKLGYTAVRGA